MHYYKTLSFDIDHSPCGRVCKTSTPSLYCLRAWCRLRHIRTHWIPLLPLLSLHNLILLKVIFSLTYHNFFILLGHLSFQRWCSKVLTSIMYKQWHKEWKEEEGKNEHRKELSLLSTFLSWIWLQSSWNQPWCLQQVSHYRTQTFRRIPAAGLGTRQSVEAQPMKDLSHHSSWREEEERWHVQLYMFIVCWNITW